MTTNGIEHTQGQLLQYFYLFLIPSVFPFPLPFSSAYLRSLGQVAAANKVEQKTNSRGLNLILLVFSDKKHLRIECVLLTCPVFVPVCWTDEGHPLVSTHPLLALFLHACAHSRDTDTSHKVGEMTAPKKDLLRQSFLLPLTLSRANCSSVS